MSSTLTRDALASAPVPASTTPVPRADPWHWAVTGASFIAVLAAATSLNGVMEPWTWFLPVIRTLVPVLLAMALTRTLCLRGVLTALVGVLALVGALTAQFFVRQSILGVIPGPGTSLELQRLLDQAEETVVSQVAPVLPGAGILLILCAGVGLIAIIADIFSTTVRMPAASGLALITVMIAPALVKPNGVGMFAFVATVLAYLLLLAIAQWRENRLTSGGVPAFSAFAVRSVIIGAASLAVAVALPLFIPGFNSGVFSQGARLNMWGNATGLNPAVTLGNDLRNPSGFGRITYSTDSDSPVYLRAVTLENFSGRRWEPDQRSEDRERGVAEIGTELGTPEDPAETDTVFTRITTQSYASPWLLAPYSPMGVSNLRGAWTWDPMSLSILATDGGSTARQEYLVQSRSTNLTRESLGSIRPSGPDAVSEVFTELPDDTPDIVRTTAEEVAGEFVNPYDKALAIQNYLRGPDFTYSEEAPVDGGYDGSGMDVMGRFLEAKSGYCVHFAGTMAVMARVAGIPSRVAVGYTPGSPTGNTEDGPGGTELREFVVDSRNAHAWPELYFESVGWVRFEPTPSRGVVPTYAQQAFTPVGPRADDTDALNPGSVPETLGQTGSTAGTSDPTDDTPTNRPLEEVRSFAGAITVIGVALFTSVPFLLRTARSRARRRAVALGDTCLNSPNAATAAWAETTDLANDYGHPLQPTDTPRTFAGRLTLEAGLAGKPTLSLTRLRTAYEYEEYAGLDPNEGPGGPSGGVAVLPRSAPPQWDDVDILTRALRDGSSWRTRIRARLLPRSLLNRFRTNARH